MTWQWQEELDFIWRQLELSSCYGQQAFRQQCFYRDEQKKDLEKALDELTALMKGLREQPNMGTLLSQFFQSILDIQNELKVLHAQCFLTPEGYFQLKVFLLAHEKIEKDVFPWLQSLSQMSVKPMSLNACLDILDPSGQRLPTFFLDGSFSGKLAEIRGLKRKIEQRLRSNRDATDREEWLERRREIVQIERLEEERVLLSLQQRLTPYIFDWQQYLNQLGYLELLLAKAKLAFRKNMVRPSISEDSTLFFSGLRHPMVEEILHQKNRIYMPIDLRCSQGATVITGANMGGKSVTLRAVIINCLLFQMGYFVFAKEAKLPLFEHLTLLDEVRQSVQKGLSSFAMEVSQLQQQFDEHKGKIILLVLDEFGRGTNPQEGASLIQAVTHYLQQQVGVAIIATHYDEVSEQAGAHYQVRGFNHLSLEQIQQAFEHGRDTVQFLQEQMDYRLELASKQRSVPHEARLICKAFRLEQEIIDYMENKITKRNP
jgi:hypothetical protein